MFSAIRDRLTPKSIRAQLTLWYLLMLGALAAFAAVVFLIRVETLSREVDAALVMRASRMASELRRELLEIDVGRGIGRERAGWSSSPSPSASHLAASCSARASSPT